MFLQHIEGDGNEDCKEISVEDMQKIVNTNEKLVKELKDAKDAKD